MSVVTREGADPRDRAAVDLTSNGELKIRLVVHTTFPPFGENIAEHTVTVSRTESVRLARAVLALNPEGEPIGS